MKSGFVLLRNKVCNNKLSEAFFNEVLNPDDPEMAQRFDRLLAQRIATYAPGVDEIAETAENEPESRYRVLAHVVETVPTFLFRLVMDWKLEAGDTGSWRNLFLGVLSSLIWRDSESRSHIDAFIADIDPTADLRQLNSQLIQKTDGESSVPKKVFADFLAMLKFPFSAVERNDLSEQIENLYCFEALSQFLLTYYFDLLRYAETGTVTGFIHVIFLRLFAAVQKRESAFWELYPDKPGLRQELLEAVGGDDPAGRHPLLRKTAFKSVQLHNPLFIAPGEMASEVFVKRFNQRLASFLSLSPMGSALLLDTLMMLRGRGSAELVIECLYVEDRSRFSALKAFLEGEKKQAHQSLNSLLDQVAERNPTQRIVTPSPGSVASPVKMSLTQDQVAEYLKEQMLKYHRTIKPEGALTRDQIPSYLASLSREIAGSLEGPSMDRKGIVDFVERVAPDIAEMASLGMLASEEKDAFRDQLCRQAEYFSETYQPEEESEAASDSDGEPDVAEDPFLTQEIIPIGFEAGAPRIPVGVFFRFPFIGMDGTAEEPFLQHLAYLEEAVGKSVLESGQLAEIKSRLDEIPRAVYRKTYDIFPSDGFDESILLVVFSLWRNNVLDNLLADAQ